MIFCLCPQHIMHVDFCCCKGGGGGGGGGGNLQMLKEQRGGCDQITWLCADIQTRNSIYFRHLSYKCIRIIIDKLPSDEGGGCR